MAGIERQPDSNQAHIKSDSEIARGCYRQDEHGEMREFASPFKAQNSGKARIVSIKLVWCASDAASQAIFSASAVNMTTQEAQG